MTERQKQRRVRKLILRRRRRYKMMFSAPQKDQESIRLAWL